MNEFDSKSNSNEEAAETSVSKGSSLSNLQIRFRSTVVNYSARLAELEIENSRLHRLIAELLIKNQQLRKAD